MERAVKTPRPGEPAVRQARTRRTRVAVVEAAQTLFLERGYAATTIEAISDLSDTPQATVYRLFSSKIGILRAVVDVAVVGDGDAIAMLDRPPVRTLLSDTDPRSQLKGFAALLRHVMGRIGPVHRILSDAARSDEDAVSLLADIARQRHEGQNQIARSLARHKNLRPGLRERDAADIIYAVASPEVYRLLVLERGWSGERYQEWMEDTLIDQLLPSDPPPD